MATPGAYFYTLIALLVAMSLLLGAIVIEASDGSTVAYGASQDVSAHSTCRRVTNGSATGLSVYVPTNSAAEWASFYGAPPTGVTASGCVTAGAQTFPSTGTFIFTVPAYNNLTVELWGGGGGGAGGNVSTPVAATSGGSSNWNNSQMVATGGTGGAGATTAAPGGTGVGGTTNLTGGNGAPRGGVGVCGWGGGAGANGGAGGAGGRGGGTRGGAGSPPGGGGGGGCSVSGKTVLGMPTGGGGGYAARTYATGAYAEGAQITVVVGGAGAFGNGDTDGGNGAAGQVRITWN